MFPPTTLRLSQDHDATRSVVLAGLREYNFEHLGASANQPLNIDLVDQEGNTIGGLLGSVQFEWLFVDILWIPAEQRGGGLGSRILELAEQEAKNLGATRVRLDTFTFQAPGFYDKRGYSQYGIIKNFLNGHDRIFYMKDLAD